MQSVINVTSTLVKYPYSEKWVKVSYLIDVTYQFWTVWGHFLASNKYKYLNNFPICNKWISKEINEFRFWRRCHLLFSHMYQSLKSDDFSLKLHRRRWVVHRPIILAFATVVQIGGGLSFLKKIQGNGNKLPNNPAPTTTLQLTFSIIFLSFF